MYQEIGGSFLINLKVFLQRIAIKAHRYEKKVVRNHDKCIEVSFIPQDADTLSSSTVYKVKNSDEDSLKLKTQIAANVTRI